MKLYAHKMATNPRRVGIYVIEKGLNIERIDIDLEAGEHKRPEFLARNPAGKVPVLELDDGSYLPESAAIMEYLEELHPHPPMIGATPEERARVRALERIANDLIVRAGIQLQHGNPRFAKLVKQDLAVATGLRPYVEEQLAVLEQHIGDHMFMAGPNPTIADCSLFALFQTCRVRLEIPFAAEYPRLDAWYGRFARRPSAAY